MIREAEVDIEAEEDREAEQDIEVEEDREAELQS